jgi:hypothetical protein
MDEDLQQKVIDRLNYFGFRFSHLDTRPVHKDIIVVFRCKHDIESRESMNELLQNNYGCDPAGYYFNHIFIEYN